MDISLKPAIQVEAFKYIILIVIVKKLSKTAAVILIGFSIIT